MENLMADHLSRLDNPHKDVFENKDINKKFPLETLGKISSGSTLWFADFANFHAGILLSKGCHPSKRRNSLRTLNITSGTIPTYFGYERIKSFDGVCMAKKLLISLKRVMKDPPGAIMVPISPQERMRCLRTLFKFEKYLIEGAPHNDARVVVKFLKSLFARFENLRAIISGRGTHFCNDKFAKVISKYGDRLATLITHKQVVKWRTAYKTPIGCTLYKLVYGKSCHLPIELEHKAYWALKHVNFDLKTVGDHRKLQLNELKELHDQAYENSLIYKEKTKKIHDLKIKNRIFNVGDWVLLFDSRLKIFLGKLKTRWSGPFTITKVFQYGTVDLSQPDGPNFKVNGHRLKHYFRGDVPQLVVSDLQTFPMNK
nr:reverse transcriptase domain-containing protein [Tanacetum cinerariifolium]